MRCGEIETGKWLVFLQEDVNQSSSYSKRFFVRHGADIIKKKGRERGQIVGLAHLGKDKYV